MEKPACCAECIQSAAHDHLTLHWLVVPKCCTHRISREQLTLRQTDELMRDITNMIGTTQYD